MRTSLSNKSKEKQETGQPEDFRVRYKTTNSKRIAVIGAGWYGSHIASSLAKKGDEVTLFEAKSKIFDGISGSFGTRLQSGPRYPRSYVTRKACQRGSGQFQYIYPELLYEHKWSIYAIGKHDAEGRPSKVTKEKFKVVCAEGGFKGEVEPHSIGLNPEEIDAAFDFEESSAISGPHLREYFEKLLEKHKVNVRCNFKVLGVEQKDGQMYVTNGRETQQFDHVINTTSFQSLLPKRALPFGMTVVYQLLLALHYKDNLPGTKPVSFTTVDGLFPSITPVVTHPNQPVDEYIMTHAMHTTVGSYSLPAEAYAAYKEIDDAFVNESVKKPSETHMQKLWPAFAGRFEYTHWSGTVLARTQTNRDLHTSLSFQDLKNKMIYVFPGEISGALEAEMEVGILMSDARTERIVNGYRFVQEGLLDEAKMEIKEEIFDMESNPSSLQTHRAALLRKRQVRIQPAPHTQTSIRPTCNTHLPENKVSLSFKPKPPPYKKGLTEYAPLTIPKLGKLLLFTGMAFLAKQIIFNDYSHPNIGCLAIAVLAYIFSELPPIKSKIDGLQSCCFFKFTQCAKPADNEFTSAVLEV